MATNFPGSLDSFPSDFTLASHTLGTDPHSTLHGNLGDSVAALEVKVGVTNSAVTTSLDYRVNKPGLVQGRLTLTSGTPVTTGDVTGATTLYFTPYKGSAIALYGNSTWTQYNFSEISVSLSGLVYTANPPSVPATQANLKCADIFAYWNGSAVALEILNWTDGGNRATALVLQDGVRVKSGDSTRLYLGTVAPSAAGTSEDSISKRLVYNYYNRIQKKMLVLEAAASWVYNTNTLRPSNNNTNNRLQVAPGVQEDTTILFGFSISSSDTINRITSIGLDSTSAASDDFNKHAYYYPGYDYGLAYLNQATAIGYHYYQLLEAGPGSGSTTWYGSSLDTAISGLYFC